MAVTDQSIENSTQQPRAGETYDVERDELPAGLHFGEIGGGVYVEKDNPDESNEPGLEMRRLSPGDILRIDGEEVEIISTGVRSNFSQKGLYRLGFAPEAFGTPATLYIDRTPYLLDLTNGPVKAIDPDTIDICRKL